MEERKGAGKRRRRRSGAARSGERQKGVGRSRKEQEGCREERRWGRLELQMAEGGSIARRREK